MNDTLILDCWQANSEPWTLAVRQRRIESRVLATDAAIVDAVIERKPATVLDIGCGEGWLCRELDRRGIDVLGVDAVTSLIERARAAGRGRYEVVSHDGLIDGLVDERFDVCVCNFSLLGEVPVNRLVAYIPALLNPGGVFIVQTLHPLTAEARHAYRDGWRDGSWPCIDVEFSDPAPWYFRTLQTWIKMYADAGLRIIALREPSHPQSFAPLSMILVGAVGG